MARTNSGAHDRDWVSMTGYGSADTLIGNTHYSVELRSVNSRFLDIQIRGAISGEFENLCRKKIASRIARGRVELSLNLTDSSNKDEKNNSIFDERIFSQVISDGKGLLSDSGAQSLDPALVRFALERAYQEPIRIRAADRVSTEVCEVITSLVSSALQEILTVRNAEGESIRRSIRDYVKNLVTAIVRIRQTVIEASSLAAAKLEERIKKILGDIAVGDEVVRTLDPIRMNQEIAHIADKCDVTEELDRLNIHLLHLSSLVTLDGEEDLLKSLPPIDQEVVPIASSSSSSQRSGSVGKRVDFLLQEIHRELNTTSVKSQSAPVQHLCIEAKLLVEQIKEQIQNIE